MSEQQDITQHEGKKYLHEIHPAVPLSAKSISIDVYCVIKAFKVTCPARQHAIKKLLCAGRRSKGDTLSDLIGVLAAVNRAIELEKENQQNDQSQNFSIHN